MYKMGKNILWILCVCNLFLLSTSRPSNDKSGKYHEDEDAKKKTSEPKNGQCFYEVIFVFNIVAFKGTLYNYVCNSEC